MNEEKKLPRPSVEQLKKFDELYEMLKDENLTEEQQNDVMCKLNDMISAYDLSNYVFDDPVSGKQGIKNPAGEVIVPAIYDEFCFIGDHYIFRLNHVAAKLNGKYGIVSVDGSNKVICEFRFDDLQWYPYAGLYIACWGGDKMKFGLVNFEGKMITPNIFEKLYEPCNSFMMLEANGKYGGIDVCTHNYIPAVYDDIDVEPDENMVFHKDGIEGYVVQDTGKFITKEQYENDDEYADAYCYNAFLG